MKMSIYNIISIKDPPPHTDVRIELLYLKFILTTSLSCWIVNYLVHYNCKLFGTFFVPFFDYNVSFTHLPYISMISYFFCLCNTFYTKNKTWIFVSKFILFHIQSRIFQVVLLDYFLFLLSLLTFLLHFKIF